MNGYKHFKFFFAVIVISTEVINKLINLNIFVVTNPFETSLDGRKKAAVKLTFSEKRNINSYLVKYQDMPLQSN